MREILGIMFVWLLVLIVLILGYAKLIVIAYTLRSMIP
jgi:hypothetical protein